MSMRCAVLAATLVVGADAAFPQHTVLHAPEGAPYPPTTHRPTIPLAISISFYWTKRTKAVPVIKRNGSASEADLRGFEENGQLVLANTRSGESVIYLGDCSAPRLLM